jgi:hypothetical protein
VADCGDDLVRVEESGGETVCVSKLSRVGKAMKGGGGSRTRCW